MSQPSAAPALRVVSCVRWAAPAAKTATLAWLLLAILEKMSLECARADGTTRGGCRSHGGIHKPSE